MRWGLIIVLLAVGTATAQSSQGVVSGRCWKAIEKVAKQGVETTLFAVDVETGEVIATHAAGTKLIPASVQKILTSGAAVIGLGADHLIYTDLLVHGAIKDGVLTGAIRLRGEGDPTLEAEAILPALARRLAKKGVSLVDGDLLVDDRLFDRDFLGPAWPKDDPVRRHMAEVAALSLDHGTVRIHARAAATGGRPASLTVSPPGVIRLAGAVQTVAKKQKPVLWAARGNVRGALRVGGSISKGGRSSIAVSIHDPSMAFGLALRAALRAEGVRMSGVVRRPTEGEMKSGGHLVARVKTRVRDVLPVLLGASQNHRAEMLFKHLGAAFEKRGSFAGGGDAVRAVLGKAGVDLRGARIADGSGLSRDNRVSSRHLVATLRAIWNSPARGVFVDALAQGGEPGTTMRRRHGALGARLSVKTGTLAIAKGLGGYVRTQGGRTLAFAVLMNSKRAGRNSAMSSAQDAIVSALAGLGS